jgi:hypothetical protein
MIEFVNRNLEKTEPDYFYLVREHVTTFKMDIGENDSFTHEQKFEGKNLLKSKTEAERYYWNRLNGLVEGKYFLEFASPQNFVFGENAALSVVLSLVEYYTEDEFFEHPLIGESDETIAESVEIETAVLKSQGYI